MHLLFTLSYLKRAKSLSTYISYSISYLTAGLTLLHYLHTLSSFAQYHNRCYFCPPTELRQATTVKQKLRYITKVGLYFYMCKSLWINVCSLRWANVDTNRIVITSSCTKGTTLQNSRWLNKVYWRRVSMILRLILWVRISIYFQRDVLETMHWISYLTKSVSHGFT